ncbi:MAG: YfhO family protein [Oscillospiraceae bacterium]|jgi:uncharacterized membrane protein YfhO|nr:YfhO family protein [Oscillospiraceae bacterium]
MHTKDLRDRARAELRGNLYCFVAFAAAAALVTIIYYCYHVIPFGPNTVLRMDLYHQYGPLFAEMYDRVTGFKSLFYSWTTGMGGNFQGNLYNYVCSPLNVVTLLLGRERILESISLIILLNSAFAAMAFTYFLKRSRGLHSPLTAGFGVLYALCGWFIAYSWNVMWLDGMTLLPLVALGVELIIKEKKGGWMLFALSVTLFSNYYMGFMAAIFAVLYFITYYFSHHRLSESVSPTPPVTIAKNGVQYVTWWERLWNARFLNAGVRFAFTGLAAAGLTAFALLPVAFALGQSSATKGLFPENLEFHNNIFAFLANHLASLEPTIRSSGDTVLPNVYTGIAPLLLVPLFLFSKKIAGREKVMYTLLLAALFFSFTVNSLNYIWHGFHFPNDLPFRFSFIYSFVLLIIAVRAAQYIKDFKKEQILGAGLLLTVFILFVQQLGHKNLTTYTIWISLAFAFLYTVLFGLLGARRDKATRVGLAAVLLCVICAEMAIASTDHYSMDQPKKYYADDRSAFVDLKERLDERENGAFYRLELSNLRARMDPAWYGYNGLSTFSSMAYEKTANLEKRLGMFSNYINSYTYFPQTPVYNAMHALDYLVVNNADGVRPSPNPTYYQKVADEDKFHAYKNVKALPVAFGVQSALLNDWAPFSDYDPFSVQNEWFALATGEGEVLHQLPVDAIKYANVYEIPFTPTDVSFAYQKQTAEVGGTVSVNFKAPSNTNLYLYATSSQITTATIRSGVTSQVYNPNDEYIVDLGACKKDEAITVEMIIPADADKASGAFNIRCVAIDDTVFQRGFAQLNAARLNITDFSETRIAGNVTMASDGLLFTSIPYDKGWHVTVDGLPVALEWQEGKYSEALLTIPLAAGEHTVTLRFIPQGLLAGIFLTVLTALSLAGYWALLRLVQKKQARTAVRATAVAFSVTPTPTQTLEEMVQGAGYNSIFSTDDLPPLDDLGQVQLGDFPNAPS